MPGWLLLTAVVTAYDVWAVRHPRQGPNGEPCSRTLTAAWHRAFAHPVRRWPVSVTWLFLTGHLFRFWPRRYDPIYWIADALTPRSIQAPDDRLT